MEPEGVNSVEVLSATDKVAAVMSPIRRRLIQSLETPDSASGLARRLGMSRQKVNYHLRQLERAGLVELAEELQRRGCVERRVRLTARAFVVSPEFMEGLGEPELLRDRFSSAYLVASAARVVTDVARLRKGAEAEGKKLATLALETELSLRRPSDFNEFARELTEAIAALASKYGSTGKGSRRFKVVVASHPVLSERSRADGAS